MTSNKGKHSGGGSGAFYRDLAMMIAGIVLVGAAVFFLLFLLADNPDAPTTSTVVVTTTTMAVTTTAGTNPTSTTTTIPASTTTEVQVRPPDEVRVLVLNSTNIVGAAGALTTELDGAGYITLQASDYDPLQDPSRIWYRDSFSPEANELLVFVPVAIVEALPDESIGVGADIVIVLGTGYEP